MRFVLILPFIMATAIATQGQQPAAQISGRVVRADNAMPMEGVTVQLEKEFGDMMMCYAGDYCGDIAKTDRNGNYALQGIPVGDYSVHVHMTGFISGYYPHSSDTAYKTTTSPGVPALVMKDGTQLRDIDFALHQGSTMRGMVVANGDKPLPPFTPVVAIRKGIRPGDGSTGYWTAGTAGHVDQQGRFEVRELPPGQYTLCVGCQIFDSGERGIAFFGDLAATTYAATWYGDTLALEKAIEVPLQLGEERNDLKITLNSVKRYNVIVWPSGPGGYPPPRGYSVYLLPWYSGAVLQPNGSYIIPNVPPGHYNVMLWAEPNGQKHQRSTPVDVSDADVSIHIEALDAPETNE